MPDAAQTAHPSASLRTWARTIVQRSMATARSDHRAIKEHRRKTDIAAGSISPQKLYGTPVGLMFFEGAPRLCAAGVTVPGLQEGDPARVVVEAYPGILARAVIGRRSDKQDTKAKQSQEQAKAREDLFNALLNGAAQSRYGL